MPDHIYFVPREGDVQTVFDSCLVPLENQANPLRDRAWQGLITEIDIPFKLTQFDRVDYDRLFLGVDPIVITDNLIDPFVVEADSLGEPRPRPILTAEVILVGDPFAVDAANFIER